MAETEIADPAASPDAEGADNAETVPYPWTTDADEQRRLFIFELMVTNHDATDSAKLVRDMSRICEWIRTGAAVEPARLSRIK